MILWFISVVAKRDDREGEVEIKNDLEGVHWLHDFMGFEDMCALINNYAQFFIYIFENLNRELMISCFNSTMTKWDDRKDKDEIEDHLEGIDRIGWILRIS